MHLFGKKWRAVTKSKAEARSPPDSQISSDARRIASTSFALGSDITMREGRSSCVQAWRFVLPLGVSSFDTCHFFCWLKYMIVSSIIRCAIMGHICLHESWWSDRYSVESLSTANVSHRGNGRSASSLKPFKTFWCNQDYPDLGTGARGPAPRFAT